MTATDPLYDFFYREDEIGPDLGIDENLAEDAMPLAEEERIEYLSFWLADEEYGVPIRVIREIQKLPPITEVPRAPAHILGVITLRGEVIPLFDPKLRLGLPRSDLSRLSRVVIVDVGDGACGMIVDRVADVVRLSASQIEPPPHGFSGVEGEFLTGVGRARDKMLILLDLSVLLKGTNQRSAMERAPRE